MLYSVLDAFHVVWCFFVQAEDGIRDLVRSRGLGDVYKRQRPTSGRASVKKVGDITIIDDSYNANPSSMRAALELSLIHI